MLDLNELDTDNIPGISRAKGNELAEAGAVCLESQGHTRGARLTVRNGANNSYRLDWPPVTDQARRTWNDEEEATEDGAVGIAVLLASREIGYTVVSRSRKGTGFDYLLGEELGEGVLDSKARMEVSGIRNGNDSQVRARVQEKLRQMNRSNALGLPAYAIVVEFGRPLAEIKKQ